MKLCKESSLAHMRTTVLIFLLQSWLLLVNSEFSTKYGFSFKESNLISFTYTDKDYLKGVIADLNKYAYKWNDCKPSKEAEICKVVESRVKLEVNLDVKHYNNQDKTACHELALQSYTKDYTPQMCFDIGRHKWFGAAELQIQRWPLNDVTLPMQPFVTNDLVPTNSSFGNVIERYWMNSDGVAILVGENTPLFSSFNASSDGKVCFEARYDHPYVNLYQKLPILNLLICKSDNVKLVHQYVSGTLLDKSVGFPDSRMFTSPIWSTWARYKVDINQQKVLEYAEEIMQNGFSHSQIEIDDMFSSFYGELDFTTEKFPDARDMVQTLKTKGFRVTVWITPFANLDSPVFITGMIKSFWLQDRRKQVPALVKWWQGIGATLDVSNSDAVSWFVKRLEDMRHNYGIDSFKFDAGEVSYLPYSYGPEIAWENPSNYTTLYVEAVSALGDMIEVNIALLILLLTFENAEYIFTPFTFYMNTFK